MLPDSNLINELAGSPSPPKLQPDNNDPNHSSISDNEVPADKRYDKDIDGLDDSAVSADNELPQQTFNGVQQATEFTPRLETILPKVTIAPILNSIHSQREATKVLHMTKNDIRNILSDMYPPICWNICHVFSAMSNHGNTTGVNEGPSSFESASTGSSVAHSTSETHSKNNASSYETFADLPVHRQIDLADRSGFTVRQLTIANIPVCSEGCEAELKVLADLTAYIRNSNFKASPPPIPKSINASIFEYELVYFEQFCQYPYLLTLPPKDDLIELVHRKIATVIYEKYNASPTYLFPAKNAMESFQHELKRIKVPNGFDGKSGKTNSEISARFLSRALPGSSSKIESVRESLEKFKLLAAFHYQNWSYANTHFQSKDALKEWIKNRQLDDRASIEAVLHRHQGLPTSVYDKSNTASTKDQKELEIIGYDPHSTNKAGFAKGKALEKRKGKSRVVLDQSKVIKQHDDKFLDNKYMNSVQNVIEGSCTYLDSQTSTSKLILDSIDEIKDELKGLRHSTTNHYRQIHGYLKNIDARLKDLERSKYDMGESFYEDFD